MTCRNAATPALDRSFFFGYAALRGHWSGFLSDRVSALVERPPEEYSSADEALAAAAKLDMLGDWDEAINLYRHAAGRWPQHAKYVDECIKVIAMKKDAAMDP